MLRNVRGRIEDLIRDLLSKFNLVRLGTGFGDGVVLFAAAAGDANGADDLAAFLDGDAAGEDHHLAVVRGVDAEELVAGLAVVGEVFGSDVEGPRGPCLFDRDVDAADPRAV